MVQKAAGHDRAKGTGAGLTETDERTDGWTGRRTRRRGEMPPAKTKGLIGSKGSGLPESMILHATTAEFTRHATYNSAKTLVLLVRGDAEEVRDANGDPIEGYDISENPLIFPVGPGWETFDDGETCEHEQGKETPHENSGVSVLTQALVDLGLEDDILTRGDSMTQAAIFRGWDLYLERKEFDFGMSKEGQPMKTSRMLPTKVLGAAEGARKKGGKAAGRTASKAAKAVEETAEEAQSGGILDEVDAKVLTKLKIAAKKADGDADAFADLAIEVDGVADSDDLVTAVADGSLFEALT